MSRHQFGPVGISDGDATFWSHVDRNGPEVRPGLGPCWLYMGARAKGTGYGVVKRGGKALKAHRYAFYLEHGRFPRACGLHRCDNPPCCNPAHLFDGTQADNGSDMVAKGRQASGMKLSTHVLGTRNHKAKLTDADARAIREATYRGADLALIAALYDVSRATVCNIKNGRQWLHIDGPVQLPPTTCERTRRYRRLRGVA